MCQEFLCFHILSKLRDYYIMLLERFDICKQNVLIGEFELTNPRNILRLTRSNLKDEQLKELTLAGQIEKREEDPMGHEFMTKADQDYVKMNEILTTTVWVEDIFIQNVSTNLVIFQRKLFDLIVMIHSQFVCYY